MRRLTKASDEPLRKFATLFGNGDGICRVKRREVFCEPSIRSSSTDICHRYARSVLRRRDEPIAVTAKCRYGDCKRRGAVLEYGPRTAAMSRTDRARADGMFRNGANRPRANATDGAASARERRDLSVQPGLLPDRSARRLNLPSLTAGKDKVVAIVDAYGYRHAASDLAYFRKTMGLKACDTSTKCLRIVNQNGSPSPLPGEPPSSQSGWLVEESIDLDMVSGICPKCKIIIVQANNNNTTNLYTGVKTAGRLGAKYIGASWGGSEAGGDNPIFHQPGIVISASAGDEGGGVKFGGGPVQPCTYTYVVCVGGTHLARDSQNKRHWHETVWNDWNLDQCGSGSSPCGATGSACSRVIPKPAWQNDTGCKMRSAADTSADASLRTPVIGYNSELGCSPPGCFWLVGGTSVSTQIISAVYALAGNASTQSGAERIWKHHAGNVYDVSSGNNIDPKLGVNCASPVKYICTARVGFDGPTGWGTPAGIGTF